MVTFLSIILITLYWLILATVTLRIIYKRQNISISIAWMLLIHLIPFIGVTIYFMFGELNLGRKRAIRAHQMLIPYSHWFQSLRLCDYYVVTEKDKLQQLCEHRIHIPPLRGDQFHLLNVPIIILNTLINDIDQAKTLITMEFYIWQAGGLADEVANALLRAADRNVTINILLDSAGSYRFFKTEWPAKLRKKGINLVEALPVNVFRLLLRRLDIRIHRKIIVIDHQIAYTGSMNLVDPRCFKQNTGLGEWVDIMIRIKGPSVSVLSAIQSWDWEVETGVRSFPPIPECIIPSSDLQLNKEIIDYEGLQKAPTDKLPPLEEQFYYENLDQQQQLLNSSKSYEHHDQYATQVIPSGPGMPEGIIQQSIIIALHQAKYQIIISTPYFVPSEELQQTLVMTAQRGVKVTLIVPQRIDSKLALHASHAFFFQLLNAGVTIMQFHGGLLHTKAVSIDHSLCLVGSVNLDMRSLWLNFETTLAITHPELCEQLLNLQSHYIEHAKPVDLNTWINRGFFKRTLEQVCVLISPLL